MMSVYKGKGDAFERGSFGGRGPGWGRIKLIDQVMNVSERVLERKVRNLVSLDDT